MNISQELITILAELSEKQQEEYLNSIKTNHVKENNREDKKYISKSRRQGKSFRFETLP